MSLREENINNLVNQLTKLTREYTYLEATQDENPSYVDDLEQNIIETNGCLKFLEALGWEPAINL